MCPHCGFKTTAWETLCIGSWIFSWYTIFLLKISSRRMEKQKPPLQKCFGSIPITSEGKGLNSGSAVKKSLKMFLNHSLENTLFNQFFQVFLVEFFQNLENPSQPTTKIWSPYSLLSISLQGHAFSFDATEALAASACSRNGTGNPSRNGGPSRSRREGAAVDTRPNTGKGKKKKRQVWPKKGTICVVVWWFFWGVVFCC